MPLSAPQYTSVPPISFVDNKMVVITFKTTPEAIKRLVPQPLVPNPDNLMALYIGRFNKPTVTRGDYTFPAFSYQEVALFVPSTFSKRPGSFCVAMYLDKIDPTVSGREVYGYPKKSADVINITDEDGKISATMERFGVTLVNATFQRTEKVEPIPNPPYVPWFLLKSIPSVKKDAPPEVMQLTATIGALTLKELYRGKGTLKLGSLSIDPWDKIPILEIVRADYRVFDTTLNDGEILHDYLNKDGK
jgi:acetoacetate decarboxylase